MALRFIIAQAVAFLAPDRQRVRQARVPRVWVPVDIGD